MIRDVMRGATSDAGSLPKARRAWRWWRVVVHGCIVGLLLACGAEAGRVFLMGNFHVVVPGHVYRSGQLSDVELDAVIGKHGIRTIINLRGCCNPTSWYLDECRATHRRGVNQEDIGFSAGRLPPVQEIRRLVEILDRTDYPILFHCNRGADRTGLASAVALLLMTDASLAEGRRQLSPRFAHLALGRPGNLDRFFDLYSEWLEAQGATHSRGTFRHWLVQEYCPGECRCRLELLSVPESVLCGEPFTIKVRCHNTSIKLWRLQKESNAGIHLWVVLLNTRGEYVGHGKAGLFDAVVGPGESIDLYVALPAVAQPGSYRLRADMTDEQHCFFSQTGQEPLEWELEVR
jgi:protein tyrosine phosphatase (PTP) superfamily phosphohydrolase (DUF442 family)